MQRYLSALPDKMQVVMNAGTASISQAGPGAVTLTFPGYEKANDALKLSFDTAVKTLSQVNVITWLEKPTETVTLSVRMQSLPDGLSYPGVVVLSIPSSKIDVKITKSNCMKLAQ